MTVPRWAPQNLNSATGGRDANAVGRDQNVYHTYNVARSQGLSMSYEDFKDALNWEMSAARDEFERRSAQQEQYFRGQLALAFEDYSALSSEHGQLLQERSHWKSTSVAVRSSWYFVTAILIIGVITGTLIGVGFGRMLRGEDGSSGPSASASGGRSVPIPTAVPTSSSPTSSTSRDLGDFTDRDCGEVAVQLSSIGGSDAAEVDDRAFVLVQDLEYRLKFAKENFQVQYSRGRNYCETKDSDKSNNIFVWVGPFDSAAEATKTCARFKREGISVDCFTRAR